jgi:hypothetical protein
MRFAEVSAEAPLMSPTIGIIACCARGASGWLPRREACNELPPSHSITSSAVARSIGGIVRPSALAVFRLTAISNLTGN